MRVHERENVSMSTDGFMIISGSSEIFLLILKAHPCPCPTCLPRTAIIGVLSEVGQSSVCKCVCAYVHMCYLYLLISIKIIIILSS